MYNVVVNTIQTNLLCLSSNMWVSMLIQHAWHIRTAQNRFLQLLGQSS